MNIPFADTRQRGYFMPIYPKSISLQKSIDKPPQ